MKPRLALLVAAALLLAGCAEDEPDLPAPAPAGATAADAADALDETDPAASEENATLGAMPHLHDYWQGRERATLMDEDVTIDPPTAAFWTVFYAFYTHEASVGGSFVELPEGALVYEGAGQLDVTVTWTDPTVTGMKFVYRHAGSGEFSQWNEAPSGQTVSIALTPEMTDMPHTKHSRWFFVFTASGTPPVATGKLHVKMEIVKTREIDAWPGHPDFWNGAEELTVLTASGVSKSQQGPKTQVDRTLNPLAPPEDVVPGDKPIPMETTHLMVTVVVKSVQPELKIDHMHVWYRAADDFAFEYQEVDEFGELQEDGKSYVWHIPVEMSQTDNPYNEKSDWGWRVTAGYVNPVPGAPPCDDGCYNAEIQYDIVVVAMKGAAEMAPDA